MVQFIMAIEELLLSHRGRGVSPRQASPINPSYVLLWESDHELALYLNYDGSC